MSKLPSITVPPKITSVFEASDSSHGITEVTSIVMAGALLSHYDNEMLPSDNAYLKEVGKNLISSGVKLSSDLTVKIANLSLGSNLFDLKQSEQYDWAIFCDWLVTPIRFHRSLTICEATLQSEVTFKENSWTKAFTQAGLRGFTIVGRGVDELEFLALHNNEGISISGEEYSFRNGYCSYRAQNYRFTPNNS